MFGAGGLQYIVDWEGNDSEEEHAWVPLAHILDPQLIRHFYAANPDMPGGCWEAFR